MTGSVTEEFKTPYVKRKHSIGGRYPVIFYSILSPFEFSCRVMELKDFFVLLEIPVKIAVLVTMNHL